MRTLIIITAIVSAIYAAPQSQDESDAKFQKPLLAKMGLMPKFLKEASEDARKEFWQIVKDNSSTTAETQSKLEAWAAEQGDEVQKDFESAAEKLKEMIKSLSEAISQSSLSTEAKDAFSRLDEITSDENQTLGDEMRKIATYVRSLPDGMRQEIRDFVANAAKSPIDNDN